MFRKPFDELTDTPISLSLLESDYEIKRAAKVLDPQFDPPVMQFPNPMLKKWS